MNLKYKFIEQLNAYANKNTYIELNYIIFNSKNLTTSIDDGINFFGWGTSNRGISNYPMGIQIKKIWN